MKSHTSLKRIKKLPTMEQLEERSAPTQVWDLAFLMMGGDVLPENWLHGRVQGQETDGDASRISILQPSEETTASTNNLFTYRPLRNTQDARESRPQDGNNPRDSESQKNSDLVTASDPFANPLVDPTLSELDQKPPTASSSGSSSDNRKEQGPASLGSPSGGGSSGNDGGGGSGGGGGEGRLLAPLSCRYSRLLQMDPVWPTATEFRKRDHQPMQQEV